MNILEARRRTLGKGVYKKTVEGNPAIAQGSLARRYPGITMQGWTEQNRYEGKNLLPVDVGRRFTGADVRDSAVFAEDGVTVSYNDIQIGTRKDIYMFGDDVNLSSESSYVDVPEITPGRYHICNDSARINFFVVVWRNGTSVLLGFSTTSAAPITIEEGDKFRIFFRCNNPGDGVQEYTIHPMLVKDGGELTTYEPYTGGQPSPNPDYPQEIVSAGKYNEDTQKWEYEITIANAQTDPDKNQTVTLTADRPLTKWDKLEKCNGQWGWVYKSKRFTSNDMFGFNDTWVPIMIWFIKNKENYVVSGKDFYCEYFKVVKASNVNGSGIAINVSDYPELQTADAMANFVNSKEVSELPVTVCAETIQETFVPLSLEEQEAMNALHTFRPTTVLSNDCECSMSLTYKTKKSMQSALGIRKPIKVTSYFTFGVKWRDINKIILKISGVTERQNMLLCSKNKEKIYIAISNKTDYVHPSLNGFVANVVQNEVLDGGYHEVTFTFDTPTGNSNSEVTNIWDDVWSKNIIYHEIMFYNGDNLLADYVPYYKGAGYMLDKKNNVVIRASDPDVYQFA